MRVLMIGIVSDGGWGVGTDGVWGGVVMRMRGRRGRRGMQDLLERVWKVGLPNGGRKRRCDGIVDGGVDLSAGCAGGVAS